MGQLAFTYLPPFQALFASRPVPLLDGLVIVAVGIVLLIVVEFEKRVTGGVFRRPSPG
jgi:hypothetical protein